MSRVTVVVSRQCHINYYPIFVGCSPGGLVRPIECSLLSNFDLVLLIENVCWFENSAKFCTVAKSTKVTLEAMHV